MNPPASMSSARSYSIVFVTAPNLKTARILAKAALNKRLIACANLIPKLESHYWWKRQIEKGSEVLMLLKTSSSKLAALEKLITAQHPYDTPEFIAVTINRGNKRYLNWLTNSLG
jgi:periplasmic divalent cation tolerance protein